MTGQEWRDEAACKGKAPGIWFPAVVPEFKDRRPSDGVDPYAYARSICAGCPVRQECLDAAVAGRELDGMWGGLDPDQRKPLLGRRRRVEPNGACVEANRARQLGRPSRARVAS